MFSLTTSTNSRFFQSFWIAATSFWFSVVALAAMVMGAGSIAACSAGPASIDKRPAFAAVPSQWFAPVGQRAILV